jgi:hypothetical protein
MRGRLRWSILTVVMMTAVAAALPASADHATRPHTRNMHAKGHSPQAGSFLFPDGSPGRTVNSDIAFWGNHAFNGNYDGFRIINIADPDDPQLVSWTHCNGDQGDIVVWEDILVRSWNTGKATPRDCDGTTVPAGWEGVHVFDISDMSDPVLVGEVELSARPVADAFGCGSHTATLVPDLENDRVIIYNQTSGGPCPFVGILEVPLDDPSSASFLRNEPLMEAGAAHDTGVILGDVNLMAVAAHDHANVFDIGDNDLPGGSLEDPVFLYTITEPGVGVGGNWHSAAFTWDGEVIILGWEPGGGAAPECEATDPDVKKSAFFYDSEDGTKLGQWTLPRPQTAAENCTIHNYNVVPTRSGRYVLVGGNYQAGTWVTEFTDPGSPVTLGWSDPPPLVPTQLGGAWSSYWYNNFIYESEITKGLNVFRFSGKETGGAMRLAHLNPQTQEFSQ